MPERRAGAVAAFAVAAILGYAALRLHGAIGEPDPRTIGPTAHVPYFWRLAVAAWWGVLAAVGAWRFPWLGRAAGRALPAAVVLAAVLAFLVP